MSVSAVEGAQASGIGRTPGLVQVACGELTGDTMLEGDPSPGPRREYRPASYRSPHREWCCARLWRCALAWACLGEAAGSVARVQPSRLNASSCGSQDAPLGADTVAAIRPAAEWQVMTTTGPLDRSSVGIPPLMRAR